MKKITLLKTGLGAVLFVLLISTSSTAKVQSTFAETWCLKCNVNAWDGTVKCVRITCPQE